MLPRAIFGTILAFLAPIVSAIVEESFSGYDYGFDISPLIKRQSDERILVTRLPSVNGSTPIRPEIRQMKRDPFKWNLYVLALSMMQGTDQDEELSWYQITGIHGVPFVPWNGVQRVPHGNGGYCTHMSILFPTWHRPYLALYEQILFNLVRMIASWFTDPAERASYEAAAADFRIPYWDWALSPAADESVFLPDFREPSLSVYGPNGEQVIANPLYSYRFRPLDPLVFDWGDFPQWTETKRAPRGNTSHNDDVAQALDRVQQSLQDRLYNLFTNYPDYGPFSNKRWLERNETTGYDSLESLHDVIHIEVGNGGHLYFIQYSAFDPLFFLHHTMVDRIVAMWQVLHPTSWVTEQVTTTATFTIENGTMQNVSTPLAPFFEDSNGVFWDSETARYTHTFGYTYGDMSGFGAGADAGRNPDDRARLSATINRLYGSSSLSMVARKQRRSESRTLAPGHGWFRGWFGGNGRRVPWTDDDIPDLSPKAAVPHVRVSSIMAQNRYTEWVANVRVMNGALDGSFAVHFFLGSPPGDFRQWTTAPNLVGTMGVFSMSRMGSRNVVTGTVPLTSSLVRMIGNGAIAELEPAEVEPFLRSSLHFRISGANGEVEAAGIEGLCVGIASSNVNATGHEWELPKWGLMEERFFMFC